MSRRCGKRKGKEKRRGKEGEERTREEGGNAKLRAG